MTTPSPNDAGIPATQELLQSELLLLPDGRVLVHELTPALAQLLDEMFVPEPTCPAVTGTRTDPESASARPGLHCIG